VSLVLALFHQLSARTPTTAKKKNVKNHAIFRKMPENGDVPRLPEIR
jgi:hypothetical protein